MPSRRSSIRAAFALTAAWLWLGAGAALAGQTSFIAKFSGGQNGDMDGPMGGLVADANGTLYGTSTWGGTSPACNFQNEHVGCGAVFSLTPNGPGQPYTRRVIYSFDLPDGYDPLTRPYLDAQGRLFLAASAGTPAQCGSIIMLTPPAAGQTAWTPSVIHAFSCADGNLPGGAVVGDANGNIYGTTEGTSTSLYGEVFRLTPPAPGQTAWGFDVLYTFKGTDGNDPTAPLSVDAKGNVYGSTLSGGPNGYGEIFRLVPPAPGKTAWRLHILHAFANATTDGALPNAEIVFDGAGNAYGTTEYGGAYGAGTVFRLRRPDALTLAPWSFKILHSFDTASKPQPDGVVPAGAVTLDGTGNLYGSTLGGGKFNGGTVFKLSQPPPGQTKWKQTFLAQFPRNSMTTPGQPMGTVVRDTAGTIYVELYSGGDQTCGYQGCGGVAAVTP